MARPKQSDRTKKKLASKKRSAVAAFDHSDQADGDIFGASEDEVSDPEEKIELAETAEEKRLRIGSRCCLQALDV